MMATIRSMSSARARAPGRSAMRASQENLERMAEAHVEASQGLLAGSQDVGAFDRAYRAPVELEAVVHPKRSEGRVVAKSEAHVVAPVEELDDLKAAVDVPVVGKHHSPEVQEETPLWITFARTSVTDSPSKAFFPEMASKRTAPNAQMSARLSAFFPFACSGLMYDAVPGSPRPPSPPG